MVFLGRSFRAFIAGSISMEIGDIKFGRTQEKKSSLIYLIIAINIRSHLFVKAAKYANGFYFQKTLS